MNEELEEWGEVRVEMLLRMCLRFGLGFPHAYEAVFLSCPLGSGVGRLVGRAHLLFARAIVTFFDRGSRPINVFVVVVVVVVVGSDLGARGVDVTAVFWRIPWIFGLKFGLGLGLRFCDHGAVEGDLFCF